MHAEIVSIGDEITSGRLLDTNSQWISERLADLGIRVLYHTSVGDDLDACTGVFRQALARAGLVIATGGLGPTADDLTREALAQAVDRPLVLNQAALAHVRGIFARRNRVMPASNERQAFLPEGAQVIHNPNGTAPGIDLTVSRSGRGESRLLALPGVPAEIDEMWRDSVGETIARFAGEVRVIRHRSIKCFGAGESQVEAMLPDLIRRGRKPSVGINASKTTIILRISAEGKTAEEADAAMAPTITTIRECLGDLVFGQDDDELQDAVLRLLEAKHATLATMEWATGGILADWLGHAKSAVGQYRGGIVVSSQEAAACILDDRDGTCACPSDSSEAVGRMASQCRGRFGADYALAVGPLPGANLAVKEPPAVLFALAGPERVVTYSHPYTSHPATVEILCAKSALNFARIALLSTLPDAE